MWTPQCGQGGTSATHTPDPAVAHGLSKPGSHSESGTHDRGWSSLGLSTEVWVDTTGHPRCPVWVPDPSAPTALTFHDHHILCV